MTMERNTFGVTITCDQQGCDETEDSDRESFSWAFAEFKENGWRAFKRDGDWEHSCPSCVEDFAQRDRDDD